MTEAEWLDCTDSQRMVRFAFGDRVVDPETPRTARIRRDMALAAGTAVEAGVMPLSAMPIVMSPKHPLHESVFERVAPHLPEGIRFDFIRLRIGFFPSARKRHLFAAACGRRVWHALVNGRDREWVEAMERGAEEMIGDDVVSDFLPAEWLVYVPPDLNEHADASCDGARNAAEETILQVTGIRLGWKSCTGLPSSFDPFGPAARRLGQQEERAGQAGLLRCIFGNPFRPVQLDPAWLAWNDGAVRKLAQVIYDERRFADLPLLADALEDASCTNADILAHCRSGTEHARGCFVLDLLLGKQ